MKAWLIVGALMVSQPALAHAMLEHATPAAGAVVAAPKQIVLKYSEALEPTFSTVEVRALSGAKVDNDVQVRDTAIIVKLKPLPSGRYRVVWHAVSVDTHRSEGAYTFTVKP